VWDPVLVSSRGSVPLFAGDLGSSFLALVPHLTLLTPNARELALLSRREVTDLDSAVLAAEALAAELGCAVLVKGGHLPGADAIDVVVQAGRRDELTGPRLPGGEDVHGTGCALASAIAAHLARGADLVEACRAAMVYVAGLIAAPVRPGRDGAAVL